MRNGARFRLLLTLPAIVTTLLILARQVDAEPARPLVFVPGLLGSKLATTDKVLWGENFLLSAHRFSELSLDENPSNLSNQNGDPACLVNQEHFLTEPISVSIYSGLIDFLKNSGYALRRSLFVFCYDWRKSVTSSAQQLDDFISQHSELATGHFDLAMHSMGGLVSRTFLHNHPHNSSRIVNYIEMAVPHQGSISIVDSLYDNGIASVLAGGLEAMRKAIFSFESFFELLPRYENCCAVGFLPPNTPKLDFTNPEVWQGNLRWLVPAGISQDKLQMITTLGVMRMQRLHAIMLLPMPTDVRHSVFAGRWKETAETVYVLPDAKRLLYRNSKRDGDGTVHLVSAKAFDEIPYVSFSKHRNIFDDPSLQAVLLELLIGTKIQPVSGPKPTLEGKPIEGVSLRVEPNHVTPSTNVSITLRITLADAFTASPPPVLLVLARSDLTLPILEVNLNGSLKDADTIEYATSFSSPNNDGLYTVNRPGFAGGSNS
jgi:pimeloyl-ACP methyl ester carboxylesterase